MTSQVLPTFDERTVDELIIDDERSFRHVALFADLKQILSLAKYSFRILPKSGTPRWDRALLLNLTYWSAESGGDILHDSHLPADVVTHVAWHHLAARALATAPGEPLAVEALFLGEAIASAFDLYLVGRLIGHAPRSTFLRSQVPAMAEAAAAAGCAESDFESLLQEVSADPGRAFCALRELLTDATAALYSSPGPDAALVALRSFDSHRFAPLLHHYELSTWVLSARAYARSYSALDGDNGAQARHIDSILRKHESPLDWLTAAWVAPALAGVEEGDRRI